MDVEKQREIIRLWNRMRQVEGPVAEEIRTRLLRQWLIDEKTKVYQHLSPLMSQGVPGYNGRVAPKSTQKPDPVSCQRRSLPRLRSRL